MENKSLWSKYLKSEDESLKQNIECDILIIGGGIAGVLTAFYLNNSGKKVCLVERNTIASGITSRMTAKVSVLQDILTKINENNLDLYLKSQLAGLKLLKENILENNIECDFLKNDSYLYTTKKSNIKKLKKLKEILERNKIKVYEENLNIKELNSLFSLKISDAYEINPLKYLNEIKKLSKNVNFFEHTNIVEVKKENQVFISTTSTNINVKSKQVVFATNYPYFLKPLFFPLKVRLEKSYMAYGKHPLEKSDFNLINIDKNVKSIRFYQDKMIYLTESKIISSKTNDKKCFQVLKENNLLKTYDNLWSNTDIITNDYLPIVGEVFKDLYIITGFNTWGILSSHISAYLLTSLIMKKRKLKYQDLFFPRRKTSVQKMANSSLNIYENINGFIKGMFNKNKLVFYSYDKAIYVENEKIYKVKRKCPHLKCDLIFNEIEKTWDCPCHGSRFDINGNVLTGPSKYDIKDVK